MPTLNWLNRDAAFRAADEVPYHLLQPVSAHGDGSVRNLLVQGDNLLALKALLPLYRGQVKCIFIDPPYNTKSAFEHYDDNLEHAQWLSMMLPRLQLLREFLREDGSIWVTIDDNEGHYLKVLMDEVFGRRNFVATFVWEKDKGRRNDTDVSAAHDHVLLFAKSRLIWSQKRNLLLRTEAQTSRYKNPDSDPRGPWLQGDNGTAKSGSEALRYGIQLPSGRTVVPPSGNFWRFSRATFDKAVAEGRAYFGKDGNRNPIIKRYLTDVQQGVVPRTWWPAEEAGSNQSAKRDHLRKLLPEIEPFATPKPEELISLALHIATNPGDLILDSFLGSGTTAAVAHKMGRRWIGIEMGEHAQTHCLPRLEKVIAGEQGGISAAVNWQGGGGFRFMRLGQAVFDETGRINPGVRFAALAAYVWQQETRSAYTAADPGGMPGAVPGTPLIGVHEGTAVLLLFNGILGDRRPDSGNVLNLAVLQALKSSCPHQGPQVVYGEACTLGEARLLAEGMVFRQIPYALAVT